MAKNQWAAVINSYADASKKQAKYDWFRFDDKGNMMTGWFTNQYNDRYYMNPVSDNTLGAMVMGWKYVNDYWYYFEEKIEDRLGAMYVNTTTPDGSKVDAKGRLIINGKPVTIRVQKC